jgi:uridylate kinase
MVDSKKIVFSLGGSLIHPPGGIDIEFLKTFNSLVREKIQKGTVKQFLIVCGGGAIGRSYQKALSEVKGESVERDELDWIGIETTHLNALLLQKIFSDISYSQVLKTYEKAEGQDSLIVIGGGGTPGKSTDFAATELAVRHGVKTVLNLSNIDQVYSKDPKEFTDAKPFNQLSWKEFLNLIDNEWKPGAHVPFDPAAAKLAQKEGISVIILNGKNFENLEKYFKGDIFVGTIIQ